MPVGKAAHTSAGSPPEEVAGAAATRSSVVEPAAAEEPGWPGAASRGERLAGQLDQPRKGSFVPHGQVRQHLAVQLDIGRLQTRDETAVAQPIGPAGGIDPLHPKAAEIALARPPVAERVQPRVHDLLVGSPVATALVAVVTLGLLENRPAVLPAVNGALDTGHRVLLSASRP